VDGEYEEEDEVMDEGDVDAEGEEDDDVVMGGA
jgi:hypothetical protein